MSDFIGRIQHIETFNGFNIDIPTNVNIYIGLNRPKPSETGSMIVTQEELERFLQNYSPEPFEGFTRIKCRGMWKGEYEDSEKITFFQVKLRDLINLVFDYLEIFDQDAVYIEFTNSTAQLISRTVFGV